MSDKSSRLIQGIPDWKIALFAGVTLIATVFFYSQSTDGYSKNRLNEIKCSEMEARPDLFVSPPAFKGRGKGGDLPSVDDNRIARDDAKAVMTLLSCRNGEDRRRLAVGHLIEAHGEIFEQVALIRDRLRDLVRHNKETSDWALNGHLAFTWLIFVTLAFAAIFRTGGEITSSEEDETKPKSFDKKLDLIVTRLRNIAAPATLIVGVVVATAQSFNFHNRYEASFVAQSSFRTLAVEVDAEIVNIVRRAQKSSKFEVGGKEVEVLEYLGARIIVWKMEIRKIDQSFAEAYADIEPITPPGS